MESSANDSEEKLAIGLRDWLFGSRSVCSLVCASKQTPSRIGDCFCSRTRSWVFKGPFPRPNSSSSFLSLFFYILSLIFLPPLSSSILLHSRCPPYIYLYMESIHLTDMVHYSPYFYLW